MAGHKVLLTVVILGYCVYCGLTAGGVGRDLTFENYGDAISEIFYSTRGMRARFHCPEELQNQKPFGVLRNVGVNYGMIHLLKINYSLDFVMDELTWSEPWARCGELCSKDPHCLLASLTRVYKEEPDERHINFLRCVHLNVSIQHMRNILKYDSNSTTVSRIPEPCNATQQAQCAPKLCVKEWDGSAAYCQCGAGLWGDNCTVRCHNEHAAAMSTGYCFYNTDEVYDSRDLANFPNESICKAGGHVASLVNLDEFNAALVASRFSLTYLYEVFRGEAAYMPYKPLKEWLDGTLWDPQFETVILVQPALEEDCAHINNRGQRLSFHECSDGQTGHILCKYKHLDANDN